ncbi:hypothetical protein HID58_084435 [Brassica napus]|uniref:non-specific serine/threonine protein kinase n=1 Tax=Brassica napus TaxID=3708 RepID=A0ABQ7XJP2_BRANA|nr:hypothetical protein HID58_084435 [Brassica napus]
MFPGSTPGGGELPILSSNAVLDVGPCPQPREMMNHLSHLEQDYSEFVEYDPSGRYGRYSEVLGKGSSKTVYRGFDEYEGIEVAWNQVKLYDFLQSPQELERLYCEIHLLKTLKHKSIMKFYTSWVDTKNRNINFITEMFTSGNLRQYRLKHKRVNIRAVKHWCRQILRGLHYLHTHDPPVIHRDLKCDNIFVNGNQGEVKIGDLGLAAILQNSHAARCVGTPEFMAPEVYEEEYNELVDIYSFGMCVLEMGKKPDSLDKVKDHEVRGFIEKCLASASLRLSARELLNDHFLCSDESESKTKENYFDHTHYSNGYYIHNNVNQWAYNGNETVELHGTEVFEFQEGDHEDCAEEYNKKFDNVHISITGKRRDNGDGLFLRLRIADKEGLSHSINQKDTIFVGLVRNIYFPFDMETDTAISVAREMVEELEMDDCDVTNIADMIDGEIASLIPGWRSGLEVESIFCNCASVMDFNVMQHGRFDEITSELKHTDEEEAFSCRASNVIH